MGLTAEESWAVTREMVRVRSVLYEARLVTDSLPATATVDRLLADADARLAWALRLISGPGGVSQSGAVK